jgi:RNA polymerase sigma-70 factor, ECF subfamily
MDIGALLARIAMQNRAAFTQLYVGLQPKMLRYAAGLLAGDSHGAADAVDEAFMDIWRKAAGYQGHGSAEGWVRHIVRNKVIDGLRRHREKPSAGGDAASDLAEVADMADTPAQAAERNSDADELRAGLARLSPDHREVVWLCYFENMALADIAAQLECPENTVKTRLFHARKQLRDILSGLKRE